MSVRRISRLCIIFGVLVISACAGAPVTSTPGTPEPTVSAITATPVISQSGNPDSGFIVLWISPSLSPQIDTFAGKLLDDRLREFEDAHPGVGVEVRIKNERGQGGLLDSLSSASAAAPASMPDLLVLDPPSLAIAHKNDLLVPLETFIDPLDPALWYDFALESSRSEGSFVGFPIGSQLDVLGYQSDRYESPPLLWEDLLAESRIFLFPAGDPNGIFTLAQYLALGGPILDEAGHPTIDPTILAEVLTIYETGSAERNIPLVTLQFSDSQDTWAELVVNRTDSAVSPLRSFLTQDEIEFLSAVALPTMSDSGIGLAETWTWAVVTRDAQRQSLAKELLEWLSEPEFLGPWTHAIGILPASSAALERWPSGPDSALANSLVTITRVMPSEGVIHTLGPIFQAAVEAVLRGEETPSSAALQAAAEASAP
jgi:ABC-type glycerol-3-phosphate transport system substrate-binding protein